MSLISIAATEFHRAGLVYVVDRDGAIHELDIEEYAAIDANALAGCRLYMVRMSAEIEAARRRGRS